MVLPHLFPHARSPLRVLAAVGACALAGTLAACGAGGDGAGESAVVHQVKAGDDRCDVDETSLDAGQHAFAIENVGSDVTEVYVYGKDGGDFSKVMGEQENIGPGTSRTLKVDLSAGAYEVACKPGMTGDGIRTTLAVTGGGGSAEAEGYDRELEVEVRKDGSVKQSSQLAARSGEQVEFKLENHAEAEYYLEVLDADGSELGEGEAPGGQDAAFVAGPLDAGRYEVKVFRESQEEKAVTLPLRVTR